MTHLSVSHSWNHPLLLSAPLPTLLPPCLRCSCLLKCHPLSGTLQALPSPPCSPWPPPHLPGLDDTSLCALVASVSLDCTGDIITTNNITWVLLLCVCLSPPLDLKKNPFISLFLAALGLHCYTGLVLVVHGLSCPTACGIFLDQGSNSCPLHCQADS